jgi:hypothetical protein
MHRSILVASLLLVTTTAGHAQTPDTTSSRECFRGRPLPNCTSFWITEAGYAGRLTSGNEFLSGDGSSTVTPGGSLMATLELGYMWNVTPRLALGGGVGAGTFEGIYFAVKPRVRFWATPDVAIDLEPSIRLNQGPGTSRLGIDAAVSFQDRLGLFVQASRVTVTTYSSQFGVSTRVRPSIYGGVRLGSKLGVAGAIADGLGVAVLAIVFVAACTSGGCD